MFPCSKKKTQTISQGANTIHYEYIHDQKYTQQPIREGITSSFNTIQGFF